MMAFRVVLYRHGQTPHNLSGVISGGSSNPPLTPVGEKEAEKVGVMLKEKFPDAARHYCSDLQRAERTAHLALGEAVSITALPAFREIDHGQVDGQLPAKERNQIWADFVKNELAIWRQLHPGQEVDPYFKWQITPFAKEEAETFMQLWERVSKQIIELAKQHKVPEELKTVTIGCHNAVMQVLIMKSQAAEGLLKKDADGLYPMFFENALLPNGAMAVFNVDESNEKHPIQFSHFDTV